MDDENLREGFLDNRGSSDQKAPVDKMEQIMKDLNNWDPYANQVFKGHLGAVWSTMSTSDNKFIFSGSEDKTIIVWDAGTGLPYGRLEGHENTVNALELAEDETLLISGAWDNSIRLWDWRNGIQTGSLNGHTGGVYCFAMSKDSRTLLSGAGDYKIRIWNINNRNQDAELDCNGSSVFGLALTSDSKHILAGGWDGILRIWNFETRAVVSTHNGNAGVIQSLVVTNDCKYIVFGTRNNVVKVWNFGDKTEVMSFEVHNNWVRNLVTTPDSNYFITCSADKTMRIVNIKERVEEFNLEGHEGYVFGLSLSKDGQFLLSGASDKTLRKWEIGKPSRVTQLRGHTKCIMSVAVTSDSRYIVSGAEDKTVRIWSILTKREIACLHGHTETVWGVAVTHDMKYITSVSGDKSLKIWDFEERKELESLNGHDNPIFCVTVSYDAKKAVSGAQDKMVIVWSLETRQMLKRLEGHTDTVFTVKITHDNKYAVSGAADYTIRIWDLEKLVQIDKIETKSGMIESVALNRGDKLLVLGDRSNAVHLWDWTTKTRRIKFDQHTKWVKCVAFAVDGNLMATCSNDLSIRVWNANEERPEFVMQGHTNTIRSVAFTSDNKYIVSGSEDLTVRLWDLQKIENLELADYGSSIDSFIYLSKIKQQKPPKSCTINTVFSSLRINLLHVYCYLGLAEFLKLALELGAPIIIDTEGHSPLYYAIQRNSQNCIDELFKYMIELRKSSRKNFLNYCNAIRSDFIPLLTNSSTHLPEFIEAVFYSLDDHGIPRFAVPKKSLPILYYSDKSKLNPDDFVFKEEDLENKLQEQPVEFKALPFSTSLSNGSTGSLNILKNITLCSNTSIYRTSFIRILIQSKWSSLWSFILLLALMSWLNLGLMIALIFVGATNSYPLCVAYASVNSILFFYEVAKAYSIGIGYMTFSSMIDIGRVNLCYVWLIMNIYYESSGIYYLTWLMVLANFITGLSAFRAFSLTRFYIRLIFRAISDSIPFIVVFIYSTFTFGMLHYVAISNSESNIFKILWQAPYQINDTEINSHTESLEYVYFLLVSIFNVVIMLNLLISILGDSFDKFRTESIELDCMEMTELVIEIENLMFWKRDLNEKRYLQICQDPKREGSSESWEGRVRAITSLISKYQEETRHNFKHIQEKLNEVDQLKTHCKSIEQKIDRILAK
jgi:WD40 repeat protein